MQSDDLGLLDRLRASGTKNAPKSGDGVYMSICDEALAEIERLRAVLKPFAAEADRWIEMGDTRPISPDTDLTVADLRRARQALKDAP